MTASAGRRGPPDTLEKLGLAPSPALSGAYIGYGELHSFIAVHIEHLLIIYLTQQSLNLRLDQRALKSSPQDKILEKLDKSIQAVFATIRHNPHVLLLLRLPRFKRGLPANDPDWLPSFIAEPMTESPIIHGPTDIGRNPRFYHHSWVGRCWSGVERFHSEKEIVINVAR